MTDKTGRYCKRCRHNVMAERKATNHILHFLITALTCGLWVFVWIGLSMKFGGWRCGSCGSSV